MKSPLSKPHPYQHSNSDNKLRRPSATTTTLPMSGEDLLKTHLFNLLTHYEKKEIAKYSEVYYLGTPESKDQRNLKNILNSRSNSMNTSGNNYTFDRNGGGGLYKVIQGDHIAYRYEVIKELDRGAFGQVLKCIDHKSK